MRKINKFGKNTLALFLAGVLAIMPAGEALAAGNVTAVTIETETETQSVADVTEGTVAETIETETTETETTETETIESAANQGEENSTEVSPETENVTENETETTSETESSTEDETETETESVEESLSEEETETETETEIETETATEEETETEEIEEDHNWRGSGHKAPKLEMELSTSMVEEKQALVGTAMRLEGMQNNVQYVENEAIFLATSKNYANKVAQGYGATISSYSDGIAIMNFEDDVTEIIAMAEDEQVMLPAVYPNYVYTTFESEITDPDFGEQNYHDDIMTSGAWEYNNAAGKGIKVAVIDSGIQKSHEDLKKRVAQASVTASAPYNKGEDNNGHGTHVSGIIAANTNNAVGGAGIAYQASIISIKALEQNPSTKRANGTTEAVVKALNAAVKGGARVVNMSLGGFYYDSLFEAAVNNAVNKGVVVVVAAGNESTKLSAERSSENYCSPACFENVITVSAKNTGANTLASFSNYGAGIIDITAPGTNIWSTIPMSSYGRMSGTSQATPMVSATAAYILSVNPDLQKSKTKATVDTVKQILQDSATQKGLTDTAKFGAGCLNVEAAVKMAAPSEANNTELHQPALTLNGEAMVKNQKIQDTDLITLTSTLGDVADSNIKIYYTLNGKNPTEKSTLYTGPFRIEGKGKKTIKAMAVYYGKKSKVTTLTVNVNAYATGFSITSKNKNNYVSAGKTLTLVAGNFVPTYTTNKKVKWEIVEGGEYATIKSNGVLTAKKNITEEQEVVVQATATDRGTVTAKFYAYIVPTVKSLVLVNKEDAKVSLTYPAKKQMAVTATPDGVNPPIVYSTSNAKVATVTATGLVQSVGNGKAVITAKTNDGTNKKVTMTVTVTKPVDSFSIASKTGEYQMASGKSLQMVADLTKDATNKGVTWSIISGQDAATINKSGKITAKNKLTKISEITVQATANDNPAKWKATKVITIYPSVTSKVALEGGTTYTLGTMDKGSLKTKVQLLPYTDKYTDNFFGREKGSGVADVENFTYTSTNKKVATVDEYGVVTAKAKGTAKIKIAAKDGSGKSVTCTIKVVKPMTYITLYSKNGVRFVGNGKTLALGAMVTSDASNKKLIWSSSNPKVATVDKNGKVKGISYGDGEATAVITATAADGSGVSQSYEITVLPIIKLFGFLYEKNEQTYITTTRSQKMKLNDEYDLLFDLAPWYVDASNTISKTGLINYSSSNPNVIQIVPGEDGYPKVVAVNKGSANIVFSTLDGSNKKATIRVTVTQ